MYSQGFIQAGFFPLLLSKVIKWSDLTCRLFNNTPVLHSDEVESYYGDQRFVIRVDQRLKVFEVIVEGQNPLPIYNVLKEQIQKVVEESMKTLNFVFMVKLPISSGVNKEVFINVDQRLAVKENKTTSLNINVPGSNNLVSVAAMKEVFKNWISDSLSLPWYDGFLSYRWGKEDSALVKGIATCLENHHCVGQYKRPMRMFLDTQSLLVGANFKVIIDIILQFVIVPIYLLLF